MPTLTTYIAAAWIATTAVHPTACPSGEDADRDGIAEVCEAALAARYAPAFVASREACNWDAGAGSIRGAYLFAVHPRGAGYRIVYLPGYLRDCGWRGPKCLLRLRGGCDPHDGDSEVVVVDLERASPEPALTVARVFLSAHCFSRSDGRCRWYSPDELQWTADHPVVWVAEGKNAHYPSRARCDAGHWGFDTCDRNRSAFLFPVRPDHNVGSPEVALPRGPRQGCIALEAPDGGPADPRWVCVWSDTVYGGWDGSHEGATPYRRYLDLFVPPAGNDR